MVQTVLWTIVFPLLHANEVFLSLSCRSCRFHRLHQPLVTGTRLGSQERTGRGGRRGGPGGRGFPRLRFLLRPFVLFWLRFPGEHCGRARFVQRFWFDSGYMFGVSLRGFLVVLARWTMSMKCRRSCSHVQVFRRHSCSHSCSSLRTSMVINILVLAQKLIHMVFTF